MNAPSPADTSAIQRDLVFDIGMHAGADCDFYLAKGFRVVGVEPDPELARACERRFAGSIEDGRLTILPFGVMGRSGPATFYVSEADRYRSSFVRERAERFASASRSIEVSCVTLADLIERHGCPYYVKLALEGADGQILAALDSSDARPQFIAVSDGGEDMIALLNRLGYNMFSIRPQQDKAWSEPPQPAREGRYVARAFGDQETGLFGLETPDWMSTAAAVRFYRAHIENEHGVRLAPAGEWYEIHATFWPRAIDGELLRLAP